MNEISGPLREKKLHYAEADAPSCGDQPTSIDSDYSTNCIMPKPELASHMIKNVPISSKEHPSRENLVLLSLGTRVTAR